jgi:hypothetical protein
MPRCGGVTQGTGRQIDAVLGMTSVEPPAGFDPLTAPDAQLACYGFPPRPTDPGKLGAWQDVVQHSQHYIVPGIDTAVTAAPAASVYRTVHTHWDTANGDWPWSGYAMTAYHNPGWTNLKWNYVQGEWIAPSGHVYCQANGDGAVDIPWVGLGGDAWQGEYGGTSIIQGGTQTKNAYPSPTVIFFWEDYPAKPQTLSPFNPPVAAGDSVFVEASYNGNQTTSFFFQDNSTSDYTSFTVSTPNVDLSSAEFINEDQPSSWDFVNFGSIPYQLESASGTWGSSNQYSISKDLTGNESLTQFNTYKGTAQNEGALAASPGAIDSYGDFTDYATSNDGC